MATAASDPFSLERFVQAQAGVLTQVQAELAAGAKTSHWMWFIFPQLAALGRSATARHFGIASLAEAQAYWAHPLLGPRLKACAALLKPHRQLSAQQIFGGIDALKLRSCLTLFERAAPEEPLFGELLAQFYRGERDAATLQLLPPSE
jgi:uncharacterized protein (DUF1810 family)